MSFMFLDLSATSSQYGRFVPNEGFKMVSYPKLLLSMGEKRVLNPSFLPEISQILHDSVSYFLLPDIHHNVFFSPQLQGVKWDFGMVVINIITIVLELKGNTFDDFMAAQESDRTNYWGVIEKRFQKLSPSQKRISINTTYFPISQTPDFAMILTECMELRSTNHTHRQDDMFIVVKIEKLRELLTRHKVAIWEEMGLTSMQNKAQTQTVGYVNVIPAFV